MFNRRQEKLKGRETKKNIDYGEESDEDEDETTDDDDEEPEEFQELDEDQKEEQGKEEKAAKEQGKENVKSASNKIESESAPKPIRKTPIVKSKSVVSSD